MTVLRCKSVKFARWKILNSFRPTCLSSLPNKPFVQKISLKRGYSPSFLSIKQSTLSYYSIYSTQLLEAEDSHFILACDRAI